MDERSRPTQIDQVKVDLTRYGVPKIDQHKIPVPPAKGPKLTAADMEGASGHARAHGAKPDTVTASTRLLSHPPPGKHGKRR